MYEDTYTRREQLRKKLLGGELLKTKEMAQRYGVSEATIKNDMSRLTKVVPLTVYHGRGGGYQAAFKDECRDTALTQEDYSYLCGYLARHGAAAGDDEFSEILEKLKTKINKP